MRCLDETTLAPCQLPSSHARFRIDRRAGEGMRRGAGRGGAGFGDGSDPYLYGERNYSTANYRQSAVGGGEPGVATGFVPVVMFRYDSYTNLNADVLSTISNASPFSGYYVPILGFTMGFAAANAAGALVGPSTNYTFTPTDVGKIFVAIASVSTTGGVFWYVNRVAIGTAGTLVGYTPAVGREGLGARANTANLAATNITIFATAAFRGTPTNTQLNAYFDAARALGDLPSSMDGTTNSHYWSLKQELRGVSNPAGRKTYGAANLNQNNYLSCAGGVAGAFAGGFTVSWYGRLDTQGVSGGNRVLAGKGTSGAQGWVLFTNGNNTNLYFRLTTAANTTVDKNFALPASLIGQPCVFTAQLDASGNMRAWLNGSEQGTGVAATAYVVPAGAFNLGTLPGISAALDTGASAFGFVGGLGAASPAQILAHAQAVEAAGTMQPLAGITSPHLYDLTQDVVSESAGVPATVKDRIGTDDLSKTGTLELAMYVATAPPAPQQLTDRITGLSTDALARVGSPTVVKIDPTIDGRKTYGAQGFSAANLFQSALGAGIRGSASTGLTVGLRVRFDSANASLSQVIAHTLDNAGQYAWGFQYLASSQLKFVCGAGSGGTYASTYIVATADLGRDFLIFGVHTGTAIRLYTCPVGGTVTQVGADVACSFAPAPSSYMQLGCWTQNSQAFANGSLFAITGGNGAATLAQLQACADATAATGLLAQIAGPTSQHHYDLTLDTIASGDLTRVPAVVLDRVGTDNLTRVGPEITVNGAAGLRLTGGVNQLQTVPGGGIQGSSAAITVSMLFVPLAGVGTALEVLASKYGSAIGWDIRRQPNTGALIAAIGTSAGQTGSSSYSLVAGDLGTLMHLAFTWEPVGGLKFYVNGVLIGTPSALAGTFSPATGPMLFGSRSDGYPPNGDNAGFAIGGGGYVATAAELLAQATASRAAGQLVAIPGRTDDRRYNFAQDAIDQATALPSRCIDRMGNADPLIRLGSGLTLAQTTQRLFSYESAPIMKSSNTTAANRWESAVSVANGGDASGFFVAPLLRCKGTTTGRFLANSNGGPVGWAWNGVSGAQLQFSIVDGSGTSRQAPVISVSADSKIRPVCGVVDIPYAVVRAYANKAQVGTGTASTGYTLTNLNALGVAIGAFYGGGGGNPDWEVLGLVMGYGIPTFAEFRAWEDACIANEDIVALGGNKSAHMYSLKSGVSGTTLLDLIGNVNLSAVGSPTINDIYARAFAA